MPKIADFMKYHFFIFYPVQKQATAKMYK